MQACWAFHSRRHPHSRPSLQIGIYRVAGWYRWQNAVLTPGSNANRSPAADSETSPFAVRSNSIRNNYLDAACARRKSNRIPHVHVSVIGRNLKDMDRRGEKILANMRRID